jgi:hypothetical protein
MTAAAPHYTFIIIGIDASIGVGGCKGRPFLAADL